MKIDKKVQIKLNDSFEDAIEVVKKLEALGFTHNYCGLREWWDAVFMEGRMILIIFEDGEILIANHSLYSLKQYDSVDEFLNSIKDKQIENKHNEYLRFNLNYDILVKITDEGIKHYVENYNSVMPFELHTSYREFKQQANEQGYHQMQMHQFLDSFGNLGMRLSECVDLNVLFIKNDLTGFTK